MERDDATATGDPTASTPERPPRDSSDISFSFDGSPEEQINVHGDTILDELFLPLETELESLDFPGNDGVVPAAEEGDQLGNIHDGLIVVEGPNLGTDSYGTSDSALAVEYDEEEQQLRATFQTLLQRPTFFTPEPVESRDWLSERFEHRHDEAHFAGYFQAAITGLDGQDSLANNGGAIGTWQQVETLSSFDEGLIPSEQQQVSFLTSSFETSNYEPPLESSSVSNNLMGILERPNFLASPAARWTAPPQWLQFQMLRNYDEGLMVSENQGALNQNQHYPGPTTSIYVEEVQSQVQINFQGLLHSRQDDSVPSAASRWEIPSSWAQSTMGDSFPIRPPIALGRESFDKMDGLILNDRRANDPFATPAVTCNFGLMQQLGYGERKLEFFPESFAAIDAGIFSHRLQSQAANTIDIIFLIITDWQPWFAKPLQEALPDFPVQTLLHFSSAQSASMLPSIDYNEGELTCIMEHINIRKASQDKFENEREIDVGTARAHCLPLVVWTRAQGAIQGHPDRPLIVIISRRTDGIHSKIANHYSNDRYKRWDRLAKNQAWVYLDLYFLFTKWDRIWGAVKQNLQRRTEEVHARQTVLPIQQQTRQLHKDNNIMISLREHVRIHKASLKIVMQRVEYMLGGVDFMATQGLKGRLDDAFQLLEYYEVTATTLLEQQQNLLSLAFNLETVAQGQAVARLNALAFIFLPLSFVASVFGITTFEVAPQWFPVAAVPTLLTTVLIAWAAHKFFTSAAAKEAHPKTAKVQWNDDLESFPSATSRSSAKTWKKVTQIFSRPKIRSPSERYPTPGTPWGEQASINDPSRLVRRSTDRSLAGRHYIPPRSTVQFLPGAYDFSNADGPLPQPMSYGSYLSPQSQVPYGTQAYDFATPSGAPYNQYSPYVPPPQDSEKAGQYYNGYYQNYELETRLPVEADSHPVASYSSSTEVAQESYLSPPSPRPQYAPTPETYLSPPSPQPQYVPTPNSAPPTPGLPLSQSENTAAQPETLESKYEARALFSFEGAAAEDLTFGKDDIVIVTNDDDVNWWQGRIGLRTGIFPRTYVEVLPPSTSDPIQSVTASQGYTDEGDETGYRPDGPDSFGLPPDSLPQREDTGYRPYRPSAPDSFGLPPDSPVDDLYSADDGPTASLYPSHTPQYPPPPSPLPIRTPPPPEQFGPDDRINYGAEFHEYDREYREYYTDTGTDLQTALSGMGFGMGLGEEGELFGTDTESDVAAEVVGRGARRRVVTLETIEE